MSSEIPFSWAVIMRPTEAHFCPVASKLNPHSQSLPERGIGRGAYEALLEFLGEELAGFIKCDPQVHASIWYKRRIEIRWPERRPEIQLKIRECSRRAGILCIEHKSKDEELITHKLSENVCSLYNERIPLTKEILKYLEREGNVSDISNLHRMGFSLDEINTFVSMNREDFDAAILILKEFHQANFPLTANRLQQLIENRIHFQAIYHLTLTLNETFTPLTKEICNFLLEQERSAKQLASGIHLFGINTISKQEICNLLFECAKEGRLTAMLRTLTQLNRIRYFQTGWSFELLAANRAYLNDINNAIDILDQAGIPLTRGFCTLLITLIKELHPLSEEEVLFLATNAQHSDGIQETHKRLRNADFPLSKDILLLLVEMGEEAMNIGDRVYSLKQVIIYAKIANISLKLEDFFLLLRNWMHAFEIAKTIAYLNQRRILFTREDFIQLVKNGALAEEIESAVRSLLETGVPVTHEILWDLLFHGTNTGAIDQIVATLQKAPSREWKLLSVHENPPASTGVPFFSTKDRLTFSSLLT